MINPDQKKMSMSVFFKMQNLQENLNQQEEIVITGTEKIKHTNVDETFAFVHHIKYTNENGG